MSKTNKLLKQAELFERLAVASDRSSFLKSLAQATGQVTDAQVTAAVKALYSSMQNWMNTNGQKDPNVGGGQIKTLPQSVRASSSVIGSYAAHQAAFTTDDLGKLSQAATQLAAVATFTDMDQAGKEAWMQTVFPTAKALIDVTAKQQQYLAAFPKVPAATSESEIAASEQPEVTKMNQAAASAWFSKVYRNISSGKKPTAEERAQWALNGPDFKGRLAQLKTLIPKASDNPYEADGVSPQEKLQNEAETIKKVISVLG